MKANYERQKKKSSFLSREILRNREIVVFKSEKKKCNTRNKKDMYWFYVNDPMTENELRNFNERGNLGLVQLLIILLMKIIHKNGMEKLV